MPWSVFTLTIKMLADSKDSKDSLNYKEGESVDTGNQ